MAEQKQSQAGISVGSSSILVIFVVLALTAFATLSLVSANSDYRLTQRTVETVTQYYAADCNAIEEAGALERAIKAQPGRFAVDIASEMGWSADGMFISRLFPMNESQQLQVTANIINGELHFISWQTVNNSVWEDEQGLGLLGEPAIVGELPTFD